MLLNPYRNPPAVISGTRILELDFGLIGHRIPDPYNPRRVWEVQSVYLPLPGRAVGGIRTRFLDQKNFATFCNQRDLEVMLGLGVPGHPCPWAGGTYSDPGDNDWFGFCCDEDDLVDDLFEREMFLRAQTPSGVLAPDMSVERRVHLDKNSDWEDTFVLLGDMDMETGLFPDTRFDTVENRWARAERQRVLWERV